MAVESVICPWYVAANSQKAYSNVVEFVVKFVHILTVAHHRVEDCGECKTENSPREEGRENQLLP